MVAWPRLAGTLDQSSVNFAKAAQLLVHRKQDSFSLLLSTIVGSNYDKPVLHVHDEVHSR